MPKASRKVKRSGGDAQLERWYQKQQQRGAKNMTDEMVIETLARMWMVCDPNRQPCDPDGLQEAEYAIGGVSTSGEIIKTTYPNPQGGQPRWKWFVPRAEASLKFLRDNGIKLQS